MLKKHDGPTPTRTMRKAALESSRRAVIEILKMRRDPALVFWSLFLLTDPIYIFKSGLPQPGDFFALLLLPFALSGWYAPGRLSRQGARAVRSLSWFVGYALVSALLWSLLESAWVLNLKHGFLMSAIYYIFDMIVFLAVLVMYEKYQHRFIRLTVNLVLISVVIQTLLTFVYTRESTLRSSGLFNTPNQLGYYAILCSSIVLLGQRKLSLSTVQVAIGQLCCCYLALLSASKAALVSVALLVMIAAINRLKMLIAIAVVASFFLFVANPFESAMMRSQQRITADQSLGFFEERGYDRIVDHPEYLIFGAGEGKYIRYEFTSRIKAHELHSSIGTLIFCYGIVGTVLFFNFLYQVARGGNFRRFLLLIPPASYGLTHQGLRFTLLWIMLAIVVMLNDIDFQARLARRKQLKEKS